MTVITTQQKKWIAAALGALIVIMFATNPDQASHLRAIKETAALSATPVSAVEFAGSISYNNYFLFSTATLFNHVVSWGAFGKVNTTNRVSDPAGIHK